MTAHQIKALRQMPRCFSFFRDGKQKTRVALAVDETSPAIDVCCDGVATWPYRLQRRCRALASHGWLSQAFFGQVSTRGCLFDAQFRRQWHRSTSGQIVSDSRNIAVRHYGGASLRVLWPSRCVRYAICKQCGAVMPRVARARPSAQASSLAARAEMPGQSARPCRAPR